ncbi:hypothetical protein KAI32_03365 [Candidatus Pacearchaeota archaeon]|nr:hypothetical protein [Candidatus Pacearchaeota archaeon]
MEIELTIKNENMNDDLSREADGIRREIFKKYPNAIWERYGMGHKIIV